MPRAACRLQFVNESGDSDVVIWANRDTMPESDRVRLRGLPVGETWRMELREQSGVHIFAFDLGSDTCLSTRFDTARVEGQSENRTATFTVRGSSVVVADSFADAPYTLGGPDSGAAPADAAGSAQLELGSLLAWERPSVEEARRTSARLAQKVPSLRPGLSQTTWEDELKALLKHAEQGCNVVRSLAEKEKIHGALPLAGVQAYRLRDNTQRNAVLSAGARQGDAAKCGPRAVWTHASYESPSKYIGLELQDEIQIEEEADGWLRYKPKPADSSQCWVKQETEDGTWEKVPRDTSGSLQTEFFASSGLELLLFSLSASGDAAALLLKTTGEFAKRVPPLALFDSAGPALDQLLTALISWAEDKCESQSDMTADVLLMFVRLVIARGRLSMLIRLAEFLSKHPDVVNQAIVAELQKLADVRGFAEQAQLRFGPAPGSLEDLVAQCESFRSHSVAAGVVFLQPGHEF